MIANLNIELEVTTTLDGLAAEQKLVPPTVKPACGAAAAIVQEHLRFGPAAFLSFALNMLALPLIKLLCELHMTCECVRRCLAGAQQNMRVLLEVEAR